MPTSPSPSPSSVVVVDDNANELRQDSRGTKLRRCSGSEASSANSPLTSSTGGVSGRHEAHALATTATVTPSRPEREGDANAVGTSALSTSAQIEVKAADPTSQHTTATRILHIDPVATTTTAADVLAAASGKSAVEGSQVSQSREAPVSRRVAPTLRLLPLSLPQLTPAEGPGGEHSDGAPPAKRLRLSLTASSTAAGAEKMASTPALSGGERIGRGRVLRLIPAATAAAVVADEGSPSASPSHPTPAPVVEQHRPPPTAEENEEAVAVWAVQARDHAGGATQEAEGARERLNAAEECLRQGDGTQHVAAPAGTDEDTTGAVAASPAATPQPQAHTPAQQQQQQQQQRHASPSSVSLSITAAAASTPAGSPQGASSAFPRLRSLTPQPYGAAAQGSPRRRHRFVNVNLPSAPPPAPRDLLNAFERTVADVYDVQEKLSEGTYGEVFKGVDKRTGALVALKRLKTLSSHQGFPQTSLREVIALRHIQSQRERLEARQRQTSGAHTTSAVADPLAEVAQLCDVLVFHRQQPDIVLVFAYASASLAGLLRRQFLFSPAELAYVMKKLLTAVRKLHEMSIIHRDIKSDNVLITGEGEVQLTDFGLCSIVGGSGNGGGGEGSSTGRRVWRTPSVITLAYRPPEMLLGSTAYDEKVDVWSVGCLLAQFFLHEPPFYRHRALQQQQQQQQQPQRTAATELEQLARITEILGPLPPARVYHPDACQHMQVVEQLEQQGRLAEAGRAAQPPNWGKLQSLFEPSFLFQQFHGFRGWFEAEVQRSRHQPQRRPTQACTDVLCAALQLDPQQRPSAAELLRMPYFATLDDAPLLSTFHRHLAATPEREEEVRRGFMLKVQRCGDSHTQRRPH